MEELVTLLAVICNGMVTGELTETTISIQVREYTVESLCDHKEILLKKNYTKF